MRDFRKLRTWNKAHKITLEMYRQTKSFPSHEKYGLRLQMRRSAASIGTNLAEGCGRRTDADFCRFVVIAMGSASELEHQLLLARDLGYLDSHSHGPLNIAVIEIKRMLTSLMKRLIADSW